MESKFYIPLRLNEVRGLPPEDRDIHAAKNMIVLSKIRLGLGRTELTPVDIELDSNGASMNEAGRFCKESSKNFILEDAQSLVEH